MHALIVHAHFEPTSFNAALTQAALDVIRAAGGTAEVSDLYAEGFNPTAGRHDFLSVADASVFHYQNEQLHAARGGGFAADLQREQDRLRRADLVILQYPLWWGGVPAVLKGWFDRVLAYGFAYVDGARFETGLFRGRHGLICVTTGGIEERFAANAIYGDIETVLRPVQRLVLQYMGFHAHEPFVCYATPRVDGEQRGIYLQRWRARLCAVVAEAGGPAVAVAPPDLTRDWKSSG